MTTESDVTDLLAQNLIVSALISAGAKVNPQPSINDTAIEWEVDTTPETYLKVLQQFNTKKFWGWESFREYRRVICNALANVDDGDWGKQTIKISLDHYPDHENRYDFAISDTELFGSIHPDLVKLCKSRMMAIQDPSHGWYHIMDVAIQGRNIAEEMDLNPTLLLTAALIHDLYTEIDRENHHIRAAEWASTWLPRYGYDPETTEIIAKMCLEHRASRKESTYSNEYAEAFACADRGLLTIHHMARIGKRAYDFCQNAHPNLTPEAVMTETVRHLKEKFGTNGYAKYPPLYYKLYWHLLSKFQTYIDDLTEEDLAKWLAGEKPCDPRSSVNIVFGLPTYADPTSQGESSGNSDQDTWLGGLDDIPKDEDDLEVDVSQIMKNVDIPEMWGGMVSEETSIPTHKLEFTVDVEKIMQEESTVTTQNDHIHNLSELERDKLSNVLNGTLTHSKFHKARIMQPMFYVENNHIKLDLGGAPEGGQLSADVFKLETALNYVKHDVIPKWLDVFLGHRGPKSRFDLKIDMGGESDLALLASNHQHGGIIIINIDFTYVTVMEKPV